MQGIAWGITGAALDCYDCTLDYGLQRQVFNRPLAGYQLFQAQLADMASDIVTSQLMSLHFGRLKDAGQLSPVQVLHTVGPVAHSEALCGCPPGHAGTSPTSSHTERRHCFALGCCSGQGILTPLMMEELSCAGYCISVVREQHICTALR